MLPLALAVTSAFAADDGYTTLDTSVVSASGYAQDTREAPASVSVITQKELATKPIIDIGTAIGDVPGVDISQNKMGASEISIRGFDSGYTLVLIDGRKQNTSGSMINNGFDPSTVIMPPPGAIDRIEVIRGPASTVWGSDSVGGVVNIITKKHVDRFTGSIGVDYTRFFEDDKYGNRWGTNVWLATPLVEDTLSLQLRARYLSRDAYELKKPTSSNSNPYAAHSPTEGFTGNIGGRLDLTFDQNNDFYFDADYTRYKGGAMNTSSSSIKSYRWWNKYNAVVGHQGRYDIGTLDTYFQYNSLQETRRYSSDSDDLTGSWTLQKGSPIMESTSYTFNTKLQTPLDFGSYGNMMLQTGLEAVYEDFNDSQSTTVSGLKHDIDLDQTTLAGFAEGEYFINEQWIATAGARLHWSDIFGTHVSPRAYLVYKPSEIISFKGGVANGYKTPAIKKLTDGAYSVSRGVTAYGNPDLKPEESWSWELSTTVQVPSVMNVTFGVFWTDFKNQLDTVTLNDAGDTQDINNGKVRAKGVELLLNTESFYGFRFQGGYTYTHAEILEGDLTTRSSRYYTWPDSKRPNELPRHSITARLDYDWNDLNVYVKSTTKLDSERQSYKGTANVDKYKNYTKIDIGANYTWNKNHHFAIALNNVTNEGLEWTEAVNNNPANGITTWGNLYKEYLDGRNLWFSYNYTF